MTIFERARESKTTRQAFDQYILTGDYHSKGNISSSNKTMTDKSLFGEEVGEHL